MDERPRVIGRAKMVLVAGCEKAVISEVVVRRKKQQAGGKRLRFVGSVKFSEPVQEHTRNIILPIIDRIVHTLDLARKNFEVSAVNLGAASAIDVGIDVSGLSADLPIFIAMLSEALQIPVSNDFVSTGHISSVDGDVSAVKGIPAKVEAAKNGKSIKCFLYPDLDDESLKVLSPNQRDRSIEAIEEARRSKDPIRTRAVSGIGQLSRLVFTKASIVMASLKEGFWGISGTQDTYGSPVSNAISFLTSDNEQRFWDVLEDIFLEEGRCEKYKELLEAFAHFFLAENRYPKGFGARLFQMVCLISLAHGKLKIDFPIMDKALCLDLNKLAQVSDYEDMRLLSNAADGENVPEKQDICSISNLPGIGIDPENRVFSTIVSLINEQALAKKFSAIDSARACFRPKSLKPKSYAEFINTLQAYYIHLQSYTGSSSEKPDMSETRSQTMKLLERTFCEKGGDKAAFVRARDGTQGGIRSILDMITEQHKAEKQDAYINRVFKDTIADMDWQERIRCMQTIIEEVGRFLPEELKNQPPERFARSDETIETIIRTYVRCSDKFNQSLSRM